MKKKLIICCILVIVLALSAFPFAACKNNNKISDEVLSIMFDQIDETYRKTTVTNQTYNVPVSQAYLDENDNEYVVSLNWEITGTALITLGEVNGSVRPVNIPDNRENDIEYTLKVTMVNDKGEAYVNADGVEYTKSFNRKAEKTSGSENLLSQFLGKTIKEPVAGTNYKLAMYSGAASKVYYATGAMDRSYYATTTQITSAADVTIETTTGGFYIKMSGKYITLTGKYETNSNGNVVSKASVSLTDAATTVFTVGNKNILIGTARCEGANMTPADEQFVLGTYGSTYTTIAASSAFYVTGSNEGDLDTKQWVCRLTDNTAMVYPDFTKPTTEAEILAAAMALKDGEYLPEGPYTLTGVVKETTEQLKNGKITVVITVGTTDVICYYMTSTVNLADGSEITVTGQIKMYDGKPEFDQGCTYTLVGEQPAPDNDVPGQIKTASVSSPVAGTNYKIVMWQKTLGKPLYATGAMSGSYLATSVNPAQAATVTVEAATDGFYVKLGDKYITVTPKTDDATKANVSLADTATSVFTVGAANLLKSGSFVLGTYSSFDTISVSNESYVSDTSKIDNEQFVARLIPADTTINVGQGTIKAAASNEHATVAFTEPEAVDGVVTAANWTVIKFTVTVDAGYSINTVKVGGRALVAANGVYTIELNGNMEIVVDVRSDTESRDNYAVTFTKAEMLDHGSNDYTSTWSHTSGDLTISLTACNGNKGNGGWDFIRAGRKNNASVAKITAAVAEKVTSITLTVDTYDTGKGTVNSVYLLVSDSDDFTGAESIALTGTFAAGEVTFNIPEAAANMHYQIVIDCASGSANGFVQISKIVYNCAA